ncbi:hypothetical protein AWC38_SpisGene3133 [Stylophora pistillata]|uniref:Peptidase A2 domain-containing protein n=1 Tax=Stylophora pistillata TaxID=50429 RepID=A0A2B4SRL0_STYPI|nr:hypothetical protein AWC38_SpisGene3133 [Stylophora pistillata]
METEIRNLPQGNRSVEETGRNEGRTAIESHRSTPVNLVSQVSETEGDICPTFVGGVTTPSSTSLPLTATIEPASIHQTSTSDSGWYVKLKVQDQELTWCIDTGAQVSVMPKSLNKESYGPLSKADRELVGADVPLRTLGFVLMTLALHKTRVQERVYIVKGASKLLLVIPAIRSFGLIHEIPGTFRVNPVEHTRSPDVPPRLDVKENIVKQYPMLFQGLGKLEGEYTIRLKDGVTPFCLTPSAICLSEA